MAQFSFANYSSSNQNETSSGCFSGSSIRGGPSSCGLSRSQLCCDNWYDRERHRSRCRPSTLRSPLQKSLIMEVFGDEYKKLVGVLGALSNAKLNATRSALFATEAKSIMIARGSVDTDN